MYKNLCYNIYILYNYTFVVCEKAIFNEEKIIGVDNISLKN